jgi:hypothetical protein
MFIFVDVWVRPQLCNNVVEPLERRDNSEDQVVEISMKLRVKEFLNILHINYRLWIMAEFNWLWLGPYGGIFSTRQ